MRELLFALFAHDQQGNRATADSQNSDQQRQRECVRRLRNMRHRGRCCGSNGLRGCGRCGGSCGCRGSRRLLAGGDCGGGRRRGLRRVGICKGHACGHFRKRCLHLAGAIVLHLNCKGIGLVIIAYAFGVALNLKYRVGVGGGGRRRCCWSQDPYRSVQRSPCRWHRW